MDRSLNKRGRRIYKFYILIKNTAKLFTAISSDLEHYSLLIKQTYAHADRWEHLATQDRYLPTVDENCFPMQDPEVFDFLGHHGYQLEDAVNSKINKEMSDD